MRKAIAVLVFAVIVGGSVLAQDLTMAPSGSVELEWGFVPDPYTVDVTAGGDNYAGGFCWDCAGSVADAPTFALFYDGTGDGSLYIYVESEYDTTLLVNGPDGEWYGNDDTMELNPAVEFVGAESGQYTIWVGSFESTVPATLYISELEPSMGGSHGGGTIDWTGPPMNEVELSSGFSPDPYGYELAAGGSTLFDTDNLPIMNEDAWFSGYVYGEGPDLRVTYTDDGFNPEQLVIWVVADDPEIDTFLLVNDTYGNWYANDDWDYANNGLNPGLIIAEADPFGQYDIWVGTLHDDVGYPNVTVYISEVYEPFEW